MRQAAGVIAAAGVTTALAGLTLRALARRRRARRRTARPGTETPPRSADDLAAELALASASTDALDRAWAAAQHLRDAAAGAELPMVTGIVVAPTGDVTLHLHVEIEHRMAREQREQVIEKRHARGDRRLGGCS